MSFLKKMCELSLKSEVGLLGKKESSWFTDCANMVRPSTAVPGASAVSEKLA